MNKGIKKPRSKFNLGLALIGLRNTELRVPKELGITMAQSQMNPKSCDQMSVECFSHLYN